MSSLFKSRFSHQENEDHVLFFDFAIAVLLVRRFLKSYKRLSDGRLYILGGVTLLVHTRPPVCWDLMGLSKCKLPAKIVL